MALRRRSRKPAKPTTRARKSNAGKSGIELRTRRKRAIKGGGVSRFKAVASGAKAQDAKAVLEDTRQELVNHTRAPGWSDADLVRIDLQIAHVDKTILELDLDDIADPPHWTDEKETKFRGKLSDAESENTKIRAVVSVITELESYTAAAEKYVREAVDLLTG